MVKMNNTTNEGFDFSELYDDIEIKVIIKFISKHIKMLKKFKKENSGSIFYQNTLYLNKDTNNYISATIKNIDCYKDINKSTDTDGRIEISFIFNNGATCKQATGGELYHGCSIEDAVELLKQFKSSMSL